MHSIIVNKQFRSAYLEYTGKDRTLTKGKLIKRVKVLPAWPQYSGERNAV